MLTLGAALSGFVSPQSRLPTHTGRSAAVSMGSTADFKNGMTIEDEGSVWKIISFLHVKPGKGPAFVRSTLKNLETGKTLDRTWRAGENFVDAQVDKLDCQVCAVAVLASPACTRSPRLHLCSTRTTTATTWCS